MSEVIQRLDEILTVFKEDVGDDVIDLAPDDARSVGAESLPHVGVEAGFEAHNTSLIEVVRSISIQLSLNDKRKT